MTIPSQVDIKKRDENINAYDVMDKLGIQV